jgi:hypothetical protein
MAANNGDLTDGLGRHRRARRTTRPGIRTEIKTRAARRDIRRGE